MEICHMCKLLMEEVKERGTHVPCSSQSHWQVATEWQEGRGSRGRTSRVHSPEAKHPTSGLQIRRSTYKGNSVHTAACGAHGQVGIGWGAGAG